MLGLERGGACRGVMYRIAGEAVETELDVLWRREMFTGAYCPTWVTARLSEETIIHHIATATGPLGPCRDYLFETVEHLAELGIRDRRLEAMARKVRAQHG